MIKKNAHTLRFHSMYYIDLEKKMMPKLKIKKKNDEQGTKEKEQRHSNTCMNERNIRALPSYLNLV